MKEFTLFGPDWFDASPDPVIWAQGGAVAYFNPAAAALGARAGHPLTEGGPLPEVLEGLGEGSAAALFWGGRPWVCRGAGVDGGVLFQFSPAPADQSVSVDRLSQIAGQMRLPLGNLIGAIQLLEYPREDRSPEKEEQYRAIQRKNYHILLRMLDSMEFMGEALGDAAAFHPVLLDFGGLCAEVFRSAGDLCARAGCRLVLETLAGNLLVLGEERMLRRMLLHLLSNGVRAAGAGGSVVFRLDLREKMVRLTVSDSGAGFSPEELARAFDPAEAPSQLADPDSGLGLGISICRTVVQRHGGRIALLNGGGGRAVVELPLCAGSGGGALRTGADYGGGLNETLIQLSDVLPWQCFTGREFE